MRNQNQYNRFSFLFLKKHYFCKELSVSEPFKKNQYTPSFESKTNLNKKMKHFKWALTIVPSLIAGTALASPENEKRPNIIFILADDMGYGDVAALNKDCKIKTPQLDRMISEGAAFTDAHSSSSVSTPTRYGILTGRYNWRSTFKSDVLFGYDKPFMKTTRTTMASKLKEQNYTTACIGKWHLGWEWHGVDKGIDSIDYSKPIKNGPRSRGFDYFYGIIGSLDMAPYVYVENDLATAIPDHITGDTGMRFWRKGPTSPDFVHDEVLTHFNDKAISFVQKHANDEDPFFLYLPYPAPHTPMLPSKKFLGKSGLNEYADFVMMVDDEVGRLLRAVDDADIAENTIIVFTTDNGCAPSAKIPDLQKKGHYPNYIYRGHKADLFDGGHRVPCIVQWKESIPTMQVDQTICLTDFFSTFASIANIPVEDYEGEDSYNLTPLLLQKNYPETIREATVHHSINGQFSIRKGDWKLLVSPSSGGWSTPTPAQAAKQPELPALQLYNLASDPSEQNNCIKANKATAFELMQLLRKYIREGRSTPGAVQVNDQDGAWKQLENVFNSYPGLI